MKDIWKSIPKWVKNHSGHKYIIGQKIDSLSIFTMSLNDDVYIDAFIKCDCEVVSECEAVQTVFNKKIINLEDVKEDSIILCPETYKGKINFDKLKNVQISYIQVKTLKDEITNNEVIIYGAGDSGRFAAKYLLESEVKILGFLDSDKTKLGDEVIKEGDTTLRVLDIDTIDKETIIIISNIHYKEIFDTLKNKGFNNVFLNYFSFKQVYPYVIIKSCDTLSHDIIWDLKNALYYLLTGVIDKQIIIYGYNNFGKDVIRILRLFDKEIEYCIEDNPNEVVNNDVEIKSIYDLLYEDMSNKIIIYSKLFIKNILNNYNSHVLDFINEISRNDLIFPHNIFNVQYLSETVMSAKTQYNKYYTYSYDSLLGYTLNYHRISEKYLQYIVYGNPDIAKKRILVLGGSTTDGGVYYPIKCWSELLFENISDNNIAVFNGGMCSYSNMQECLKLLRDIECINPDIIISYGGVNNIGWGNYIITHPFKCSNSRVFSGDYNEDMNLGMENTEDSISLWLRMEQTMKAIAELHGAKFIGVFQPAIFNKNILSEKEKMIYILDSNDKNGILKYKEQHSKLSKVTELEKFVNDDSLYDLSGIFKDNPDEIFMDCFHVYENGNKIIADKIYEILKDKNYI